MNRYFLLHHHVGIFGYLWLVCLPVLCAQKAPLLRIHPGPDDASITIHQEGGDVKNYLLESSVDLQSWQDWARSWGAFDTYADLQARNQKQRFFRLTSDDRASDWTNQLGPDVSPFLALPRHAGDLGWVKFAMALDRGGHIYFQDSRTFPFHYDFAKAHLPSYAEMEPGEFERVTLMPDTQELLLGALLFPDDPSIREVGVQFVGREAFPVESVLEWLDLVAMRVRLGEGVRLIYMPTFEQAAATRAAADLFVSNGVVVDSPARWVTQDGLYAEGWALGRLVYLASGDLEEAFANGDLKTSDILVLDDVPAEVPPVSGILSLSPATLNSHVAILAQSFGVPFAYLADTARQVQLRQWVGEDVLLIAGRNEKSVDVRILKVGNQLSEDQKTQLLDLKRLPPLAYNPVQSAGEIALPVSELSPGDIGKVGGKAANLGLLLRSIPDHSPGEAIAFTFDLWNDFMSQLLASGESLKATIDAKLMGFQFPLQNPGELAVALGEIRELIEKKARFSADQQTAILNALSTMSSDQKIRFRSSTNVEDSEQFVGAGLYDSFSGCVADDLDEDTEGPSNCDSTKDKERGVFRAIQKVYASFYNENAFIERLRRGVEESEVGMAVLAHHSFPDEGEWANGVATLRVSRGEKGVPVLVEGSLVTQEEALSVANPDHAALPEIVRVGISNAVEMEFELVQGSALVQLGATVMEWHDDYRLLTELMLQASGAYLDHFESKTEVLLDFEYKKMAPGNILLKQIRAIPVSPFDGVALPIAFSDVDAFEVVQGEFGDMMARHRLKSVWKFHSWGLVGDELPDDPAGLLNVDLEFIHNRKIVHYDGLMSDLPGAEVTMSGRDLKVDWYWGEDALRVDYQLHFNFLYDLRRRTTPFLNLGDAEIELTARYATAQPKIDLFRENFGTTHEDSVTLADIDPVNLGGGFPNFSWKRNVNSKSSGLSVTSDFYIGSYKIRGETPWILKTPVLQEWEDILLDFAGYGEFSLSSTFSQTYYPGHHNFIEILVLDPGLEPGIDPALLESMESENIRGWIVMQDSANVSPTLTSRIYVWTLDNRLIIAR